MLSDEADRSGQSVSNLNLAPVQAGDAGELGASARAQLAFQQGVFHYLRAEYSLALESLSAAAEIFEGLGDWAQVLECKIRILRILAERQDLAALERLEENVTCILRDQTITPAVHSHAHYVIGICWHYREIHNFITAMTHFERAIELALASDDKKSLAFALYGKIATDYALNDFDRLEIDLNRLSVILEIFPIPELECSVHIVRSLMARRQERYSAALEEIWLALAHLKQNPNLVLYLNALLGLGTVYQLMGRKQESLLYLELALNSVPETELPRLAKAIQQALSKVKVGELHDVNQLRFDLTRAKFWIGNSEIGFGSQVILRELLTLLLRDPEKSHSKGELVFALWGEEYEPIRHDNRVYVTIRRLRRFIDHDGASSHIIREKNGYRFNPEKLKKESP